jgi:hypothetical protein
LGHHINGEEPDGLSLARQINPSPEGWSEQRSLFGFEKKLDITVPF